MMANKNEQLEDAKKGSTEEASPESSHPPAEVVDSADKLPKQVLEQVTAFSAAFQRIGPDPETAKILAEAESEDQKTRLEGFKAQLENQDKDAERDHQYRMDQARRSHNLKLVVLVIAVLGVAVGLYLYLTGLTGVGGNVALVSVVIALTLLGGRLPTIGGQ